MVCTRASQCTDKEIFIGKNVNIDIEIDKGYNEILIGYIDIEIDICIDKKTNRIIDIESIILILSSSGLFCTILFEVT